MGARLIPHNETQKTTRNIPNVGMRGGLGRTLLTAFLLLTILPLVLIGGYATQQNKSNVERESAAKILAIATLKGEALLRSAHTLEAYITDFLFENTSVDYTEYNAWWLVLQERVPGVLGIVLQDESQMPVWSSGTCDLTLATPFRSPQKSDINLQLAFHDTLPLGYLSLADSDHIVTFCFEQTAIDFLLDSNVALGETGHISLVVDSRLWAFNDLMNLSVLDSDVSTPQCGFFEDANGKRYVMAYYPLPWEGVGLQVQQSELEVMNSTDRITATLIALVLGVVLCTIMIAAFVIRQITRPVINLTESALAMAEGNLDQNLEVKSRDEIGILTYVFNEMAADLKSLYEDLEAKVAERTKRLQKANYQIQRHAIHLQASQEVSQAITSVRDPEQLLTRVVDVIRDRFVYSAVAIYILKSPDGKAYLSAVSPGESEMRTSGNGKNREWAKVFRLGDGSIVDQAMQTGNIQIDRQILPEKVGWYQRTACRVAIPLRMEGQYVGVIGVDTSALDGIQDDELEVLELLANQVTIALENARAYERERVALKQLEAAEAFKTRFLGNMSHELREPLNTVIGFSRLLLKGVEGPLNTQQKQDIEQIYNDSQHLMFLINDILAISQIQAGLMELKLQPVSLSEIVDGVMPTASALVRDKEIELVQQIPSDLPSLHADPNRLRQIILHLLNNAAKYTHRGWIKIKAWQHNSYVYTSIIDTGIGIPFTDREGIFTHFEHGKQEQENKSGVGLGLSLCKEFVTLHGGKIWVDSEVNAGTTFTFSIPISKEPIVITPSDVKV